MRYAPPWAGHVAFAIVATFSCSYSSGGQDPYGDFMAQRNPRTPAEEQKCFFGSGSVCCADDRLYVHGETSCRNVGWPVAPRSLPSVVSPSILIGSWMAMFLS